MSLRGPSRSILGLAGRAKSGPSGRHSCAKFFLRRMVGRDPALGDEQMKAGPRSAHRGNTIIQRLPIGFVDLIEVPGMRWIETHQVDGNRGVATTVDPAPPGHADADHATRRNSDHSKRRTRTRLREPRVTGPVVRAPLVHVSRRGADR